MRISEINDRFDTWFPPKTFKTMVIKYKKGYKYQLYERAVYNTVMGIPTTIKTEYITMIALNKTMSQIRIRKGYAWDGASGPAIDTDTFMRASLFHDAMYQLMRLGLLPQSFRARVDWMMKQICLDDGMHPIRANYAYWTVRGFAAKASSTSNAKRVLTAP